MEFGDLLTQGGLAAFVILLVGVVKRTVPAFDSARFGPILAVGLGVAAAVAANATAIGDIHLSIAEAVFLGILGGSAAAGLYDVGSSARSG